jgi:tight adherence protein C
LVLFLTIAVFMATALAVLALYWFLESRRESLPQRLKEISEAPSETGSSWSDAVGSRFADVLRRLNVLERFRRKSRIQDEIVAMVTSEQSAGIRLQLIQAGFRNPKAFQIYFGIRAALPAFLFLVGVVLGKSMGMENQKIFLLSALGLLFGFLFPIAFVRWKIRKRQEEITDHLPDALDLLVVCVEAGLGLNASFVKIAEEFKLSSPTLSEEFDIVNREMVAGKPRVDALRSLADRTGVEEVKSLVAMLIQTEKLGTSLAQSLRVHSDSLRTKRSQRAEEAAAKTTIKLVFPLVFLLFPALFVVILGPGMIQIAKVLFPVMLGNR